jgi:hypothetical protein
MNETKIAEVNALVRKNSRNELARLCKEKNLTCSGTKHDMAVRLIGGLNDEKKEKIVEVVKKIIIRRNHNGQWEYDGLIFDDKTKNVIGVLSEGVIQPLKRKDIEKCKQYKFKYILPIILDERDDMTKTPADELSSDEEDDDLEDELEEES